MNRILEYIATETSGAKLPSDTNTIYSCLIAALHLASTTPCAWCEVDDCALCQSWRVRKSFLGVSVIKKIYKTIFSIYIIKMPLTKNYRRSRPNRKRTFRKRRTNYSKTYSIAKSAAKRVINNQFEKHYFDYNPDAFNVNTSGSIELLSAIPVVDSDISRTGDRVTIKSIPIKGK